MREIILLIVFMVIVFGCVAFGAEKSTVELNPEFEDHLINALRTHNTKWNEYINNTQAFVLFHFSDIHGDQEELARLADFYNHYQKYFDDAICTGDIIHMTGLDDFTFWGKTPGTEKIMFILGNHDFLNNAEWNWNKRFSKEELFDNYFAPYIKNWNVTYTKGCPYYYKDYPNKKIRLIAIDGSFRGKDDEDQVAWLKEALTGAKDKDYSVIIAQHYNPADAIQIKCNFTDEDHAGHDGPVGDMTPYFKAVDGFMNEGGKFVCWIGGHTHWEQFGYNKDFPKQLFYNIDAANIELCLMYSNVNRIKGKRSQDLANVMVVDTTTNTIKLIRVGANQTNLLIQRNGICINYKTYEVISQF
ncbi:MAG: hypothetical protein IJS60_02220 [Abditibacteriota bacterium]|nr:hypothetical protein [Abditibacteriota bacterium]